MQKLLKYDDLVAKALDFIKENLKFKSASQGHYKIGWSLIKKFMDGHKINFFSLEVSKRYIAYVYSIEKTRELLPKEKRSIRAAVALSEFIKTGCILKKKKFHYMEGEIGDLIQQYIQFKRQERLDSRTIQQIERNLSQFNFWLANMNIHHIEHLKQHDVIRFIQGLDSGKKGYVNLMLMQLKCFLRYLYNKELIRTSLAAAIPRDNYKSMVKLPCYFSETEISQVLSCFDRGTVLGKRDYAIFMLAIHMGMRASDIANLRFANLHWEVSTITFQQCKGGKEMRLPLLPVVGNAILEYLQHSRPKSNEPFVFLQFRSPYIPINAQAVGQLVTRRLQNAHLNLKGRKMGSHVLRHSLVKQLLDNGHALPVISEVLGHKSQESTKHYIRIDIEALRKCSLDVPPVLPQFYGQGGRNFFYL
jgi:site-specific recombinase XerD